MSVRYPDGTYIHRETHGAETAHKHYQKLHAEHVVKNQAYKLIIESFPAHMKKPVLDSDGDPVPDDAGKPRLIVKDKHLPKFSHLGNGRYEFTLPGIDDATQRDLAAKLMVQFGDKVTLLNSGSQAPAS